MHSPGLQRHFITFLIYATHRYFWNNVMSLLASSCTRRSEEDKEEQAGQSTLAAGGTKAGNVKKSLQLDQTAAG